jgi:hypothetical protein
MGIETNGSPVRIPIGLQASRPGLPHRVRALQSAAPGLEGRLILPLADMTRLVAAFAPAASRAEIQSATKE